MDVHTAGHSVGMLLMKDPISDLKKALYILAALLMLLIALLVPSRTVKAESIDTRAPIQEVSDGK